MRPSNLFPLVVVALTVLAGCHAAGEPYVPQAVSSIAGPAERGAGSAPRFQVRHIPSSVDGQAVYQPLWIAVDGNDTPWFTCGCGGLIGRITPRGAFSAYTPFWKTSGGKKNLFEQLLKYFDEPSIIRIGPGGNAWFIDQTLGPKKQDVPNAIGFINVSAPNTGPNAFTGWKMPQIGGIGAMAATNKSVWVVGGCKGFTTGLKPNFVGIGVNCEDLYEFNGKTFARHRLHYPFKNTGAISLAIGTHDDIWYNWAPYNGSNAAYYTRFSPPDRFTTYALPNGTEAISPTLEPDGSIWYLADSRHCGAYPSGNWSGRIGRISQNGTVKEFCLPPGHGTNNGSGAFANGLYWFASPSGNSRYLGSISPSGRTHFYLMPSSVISTTSLAAGTRNDLWMTDFGGSNLVHISLHSMEHQ